MTFTLSRRTLSWLVAGLAGALCLGGQSLSAQTTYVAYGDSITSGTGDSVPEGPGAGYPARLETLLSTTVINRGQSGGTTSELLAAFSAQVRSTTADVLLLMAGTNDVTRVARDDGDAVGLETAVSNIQKMAQRAADDGMQTIHATVIPRPPEARHGASNFDNQKFNSEVRNLAGTTGRDLVDVNQRFRQEPRRFALYYRVSAGDPVGHPNPTGYDEMADAFADVINDTDSAGPAFGIITPTNGQKLVRTNTRVEIDLWDFGSGVDTDSVQVRVNNGLVSEAPVRSGKRVSINHTPANRVNGRVDVNVRVSDRSNPPNETERDIVFFTRQTRFPTGDVNRDGRVDGLDLLELADSFGKFFGADRYNGDADFDRDGDVDGSDLAILVENFGTSI